jgi:hypothetical protein
MDVKRRWGKVLDINKKVIWAGQLAMHVLFL